MRVSFVGTVDPLTNKAVGEITRNGAVVSVYVTPTVAYSKISTADLLANGASRRYAAAVGAKWVRSSPADSPAAGLARITDLCASAKGLCADPRPTGSPPAAS